MMPAIKILCCEDFVNKSDEMKILYAKSDDDDDDDDDDDV